MSTLLRRTFLQTAPLAALSLAACTRAPRLQKVGRELGLIATLLKQHERGRQVTDEIVRLSGGSIRELPLISIDSGY